MKMRRVLAIALCLVLLVALAGCKSKAAKATEALIDAIGEVSAESETAVKAAEEALLALEEKERAQVENAQKLTDARDALDVALAEKLIGAIGEVTAESESAIAEAEAAYDALTEEQRSTVSNAGVLEEARAKLEQALEEARLEAARQELVGVWLHRVEAGPMMAQVVQSALSQQEFAGYGLSFSDYLDSYNIGLRFTVNDDGTYVLEADADVMQEENEKMGQAISEYLSDLAVAVLGEEFVKDGLLEELPKSWEDMSGLTNEDDFFQAVFSMSREELGTYYGTVMGSSVANAAVQETGTWKIEDGVLFLDGSAGGSLSYNGTVEYTLENDVMTWTGGTMPLTDPLSFPTAFDRIG